MEVAGYLADIEAQGGYLPACSRSHMVSGMAVSCGKCRECIEVKRVGVGTAIELEIARAYGAGFGSCCQVLTYDDVHLPADRAAWIADGYAWRKRLRDTVKRKGMRALRLFSVGETGSTFGRPHFHALYVGYSAEEVNSWALGDSWGYGRAFDARQAEPGTGFYLAKYLIKGEGRSPIYGDDFAVWPRPALGSALADDILATFKASPAAWKVIQRRRDFPAVVRMGNKMYPLRRAIRVRLRELAGFDSEVDKLKRVHDARLVGDIVKDVFGLEARDIKDVVGNVAATRKRLTRSAIYRSAKK